jgi:hypothetical protein
MANQVTDNRTNVSTGEAATNWEDIGGTARAVDTEVSYDTYTGSIGAYCTTTRDATMYNNGATGLFASGDHAYLLVNCGIVSLLSTKVAGGLTVRVTGATATDWAEFELFGSDEWPTAFDGGWIQIVVDIDELLANPTNTNGTPPTVGNIQRFGITFITAATMPRMADNTWVGGFKILGSATPALIVEGRDAGTTDWDLTSIAAVAAVQLSAVLKPGPGGSFVCRGPIRFGDTADTTVHAFTETDKILLWDFQEVMLDGFYGIDAVGDTGAGTTSVTFGIKSGTGDDATGAQGGVISADPAGARWFIDANNADITAINFYGATLVHGGDLLLDSASVSCISTTYLDCLSAEVHNSEQLRIKVINAANLTNVAFMRTDDINDIKFSEFQFSAGHAIELDAATPTAQSNVGNLFSGYTNTIDSASAAIHNSAAGALTITNSLGSNLATNSYRNTGGGSVSIVAGVPITLTFLDDETGLAIEGLNVILGTGPGLVDMIDNLLTNASGVVSVTYTGSVPDVAEGFAAKGSEEPVYKRRAIGGTVAASTGLVATIRMSPD